MLPHGFLTGASVYTTYAYTNSIIQRFIDTSKEVFVKLKNLIDQDCIRDALKGESAHTDFKRLA